MSTTVIVSAYYKIPSKQPHSFYVRHLQRWFRSVRAPVIFFISADVQAEIESWGYPLAHVRFVVLPFEELNAWSLGRDFWDRQKARDPERYHTPELGAVWYEKKEFVRRAMEIDPTAKVFVWCDAGCVRSPESEVAMRAFGLRNGTFDNGTLHIAKIANGATTPFYKFPYMCLAGGYQAGSRAAWAAHSAAVETMIQRYDEAGISAMSDQYILKSCVDAHPELYTLHTPPPGKNPWFFFLELL